MQTTLDNYDDDDEELEDDEELDDDDDDDDNNNDDDDDDDSSQANDDLRGLVGLKNLGNTCYMNSALQALSNCQQLTRFVLDCPGFLKDTGLCKSYSDLMKEIWDTKTAQYAVPVSIITYIKCIYPAFRGCTQQDTQEFLRCLLEQLHDELKQPVHIKTQQPYLSASSGDKTDNSSTNYRSIISDTFEFKISSSVVCSNCNNVSTTKETFKDLSIPIPSKDHPFYNMPEIKDQEIIEMTTPSTFSTSLSDNSESDRNSSVGACSQDNNSGDNDEGNRQLQTTYYQTNPFIRWFWDWMGYFSGWFWGMNVTLQDCLSIFFGTDPLEGDNEYSCEVCTKKNKGVKYLKILELPEVLCIHFKRYESTSSSKITTHVSFPITGLDLAPYMSANGSHQCTTYNLIACICHHGSALLTGHYTTYALNCYDYQWYEFDDQYVSMVQDYKVENSEAYILFYQKAAANDRSTKQRLKASKLWKKSLNKSDLKRYYISRQWINKFNTFVEPGPITNSDFLCEHEKVPKKKFLNVSDLCHPISEPVWKYLKKLHGGGPECRELDECSACDD